MPPLYIALSTAILVATLGSDPTQTVINGQEYLECFASVSTGDSDLPIILRSFTKKTGCTSVLRTKKKDDLVMISGELSLVSDKDSPNDGLPVVGLNSICSATKDQYFNEAILVGRFSGQAKDTDSQKSASRTLAVNRYPGGNQVTDWFRVRGYDKLRTKLMDSPKGTVCEVSGMLTPQKGADGKVFLEVKCRYCRVHQKGSGGKNTIDPAKGTSAAGYDHESFTGNDEAEEMPPSQSWS